MDEREADGLTMGLGQRGRQGLRAAGAALSMPPQGGRHLQGPVHLPGGGGCVAAAGTLAGSPSRLCGREPPCDPASVSPSVKWGCGRSPHLVSEDGGRWVCAAPGWLSPRLGGLSPQPGSHPQVFPRRGLCRLSGEVAAGGLKGWEGLKPAIPEQKAHGHLTLDGGGGISRCRINSAC